MFFSNINHIKKMAQTHNLYFDLDQKIYLSRRDPMIGSMSYELKVQGMDSYPIKCIYCIGRH